MLKRRIRRIKKNFKPKTKATLQHRKLNITIERRSTRIINLVGYVILFLVLLDYGFLLISSQIFDPTWAYNTAGRLVENVWGILLALILVFYRRDQDIIKPKESFLLKLTSWLTLAVGIGYFLIAPIILGNGLRIHRGNYSQFVSQVDLQKTQVQQYSQQLQQANEGQLRSLLQRYTVGQNTSGITANSAEQIKSNILAEVEKQQVQAREQLQQEFNSKKTSLLGTTVKWSIGAIISGVCLVLIWRHTQWARRF